MTVIRGSAIIALIVLTGTAAQGSEMTVTYQALERNITVELMVENGRYYIQGDPSTPCTYAFVQDPKVDAAEDRLRIRLLFSGSAASTVAGRCVGAADTFDLTITGVPTYANGELFLEEIDIQATTAYFRVVAALVEGQLRQALRISLQHDLQRATEWMSKGERGLVEIGTLEIHDIAVESDALRFTYDLSSSVR